MRAEIRKAKPEERPFPKLMVSKRTGNIVLFGENGDGTMLVYKEVDYPVGYVYDDWNMDFFEDLPSDQEVVLRND